MGQTISGKRILLIDDDESMLATSSRMLRAHGFEVAKANDQEKALAQLAQSRPELIIMDIQMRAWDGFELFDQIRADHPNLPTIIVTAEQSVTRAIDATQKGAFSYLPKPVEEGVLLEKISLALVPQGGLESDHDPASMDQWREELLTRSPAMNQLMQEAM